MPESLLALHASIAAAAFLLNAILGGPRKFYDKSGLRSLGLLPNSLLRALERKLNRSHRSEADRKQRGIFVTIGVLIAGGVGGILLAYLTHIAGNEGMFLELIVVTLLLPVRAPLERALLIRARLGEGDLPAARKVLERTSWRNHALLDQHSVARAGVEEAFAQFTSKVVSSVFWYLVGGLPGLCASRALTLACESFGGMDEHFSKAAKQTDFIVHYLPGRLAALWVTIASLFFSFSKPTRAVHAILVQPVTLSGSAYVLATVASALGFSLGGPLSPYTSSLWLGDGRAKLERIDISRACLLYGTACVLLLLSLALMFQ